MLELTRLENWPDRLMATVERHRTAEFEWGVYDCATLFADAVQAVTGTDPLAAFRPWKTERSARMKMIKGGWKDMKSFCRDHFPDVAPSKAGRGDLGFAAQSHNLMCPAVIVGAHAVSRDEKGWIVMPTSLLTLAFKVG
jgi:hypothetical protein